MDIRLRTEPSGDHGQDIIVEVDGVEVIRTFGALATISLDHTVTQAGIDMALRDARRIEPRSDTGVNASGLTMAQIVHSPPD